VVAMWTPARKRLMRDLKRLQQDPLEEINGAPQHNNCCGMLSYLGELNWIEDALCLFLI